MIDSLIDNLFNGDQGLQIQITELFKYLTDSPFERKTEILDIFYGKLFPIFLEHFQKMENDEKFFCFVQQYMELLVHCVKPHGYRFRHYFIHHKLLHELYKALNLKEKSTSLAVIRLVKSLILSKDDYLIKYITRNNLLDQIFDVYLKNARKDNLLTSACLDFFNVLQKEKNRKLIYNFGSRFKDKIYEAGLENTFQRLLKDYEELDNKMQIEGEMSMSQQENESEFAL